MYVQLKFTYALILQRNNVEKYKYYNKQRDV